MLIDDIARAAHRFGQEQGRKARERAERRSRSEPAGKAVIRLIHAKIETERKRKQR